MRETGRIRNVALFVLIGAALFVGVLYLGPRFAAGNRSDDELPTFAVRKGPLRISVSEAGTIQARERAVIKSEVEGRTTIIYLIEEGKQVEEGELLVKLDASELEDRVVDYEISVQNADAAFIGAREGLAVAESQAQSDVAAAELEARFAREDLGRYKEGEYPRELKEAQSKITLAMEELENSTETLRWSEKLFEEKYISQTELERDRLAENRARLEHELAVSALGLLEEFTHARRLDELISTIEQNDMALERVKRKASADVVQAEADLKAKESELKRQEERLRKLKEQIAKATMYAPGPGMVIYASTGRSSWRGNEEPLYEGKEVREREEIIYLPQTESKMAEIKIHESSLDKARIGQPVQITIDALPGIQFDGEVAKISPLPDGQSVWMNPDLKVYPTEVNLIGDVSAIRTGMTCRAEIIVEELPSAIHIPLQSVVRIGNQPIAYVLGDDGPERREVEIGLDNNHMIHILAGLEEGELVLLAPPLDATSSAKGALTAADPGAEDPTGSPPIQNSERMGERPSFGKPPGGGQGGGRPQGAGQGGRPTGRTEGRSRGGAGGEGPPSGRRSGGGERGGRPGRQGGGRSTGQSDRQSRPGSSNN